VYSVTVKISTYKSELLLSREALNFSFALQSRASVYVLFCIHNLLSSPRSRIVTADAVLVLYKSAASSIWKVPTLLACRHENKKEKQNSAFQF
jgi:hypothetical protein